MNKEQDLVQFEFYNADPSDPLIATVMTGRRHPVNREGLRAIFSEFEQRLRDDVSIHGGGGEVGVTRRAGCLNLQLRLSMIRACVRCA
jgi:hypothetical protein